jgi:hypothetical protein
MGVYVEKWVFKFQILLKLSVLSLIACQICLEQIGSPISSWVYRQLTILLDTLFKNILIIIQVLTRSLQSQSDRYYGRPLLGPPSICTFQSLFEKYTFQFELNITI